MSPRPKVEPPEMPSGSSGRPAVRSGRLIQVHRPEVERDYRLDVEHVRDVVVRPDVEEGVVLERQADQRRDRVLRRFGEIR
jgi:hypothetical protein